MDEERKQTVKDVAATIERILIANNMELSCDTCMSMYVQCNETREWAEIDY